MRENSCPVGTLASSLIEDEIKDENVVKVAVDKNLENNSFLVAKDFFRTKIDLKNFKIYHHIGIYIYTRKSLKQYVELPPSPAEKIRKLEQMRAKENNMDIKVGYCDSNPLSVDTLGDLKKIEKEMS